VVDVASIQNTSTSEYLSKKLENFVFTELIKSGLKPNQDVFYGNTKNGHEVDFVIKKDFKIVSGIQVCYDMDNIETRSREIRSLVELAGEYGVKDLVIVTWRHSVMIEDKGVIVRCVSVREWMVGR
jgi:predicted AAA+ superfamily ATPase